jgi:hypothetical protein
MHTIQSRFRDVDIEFVIDANRTLVGIDSGGQVISSNEVTLHALMENVVLPLCDAVRYSQWLFINRVVETVHYCNRCGARCPDKDNCIECEDRAF